MAKYLYNQLYNFSSIAKPSFKKMRTFVIGDIHGKYIALEQCLERSGFKNEADQLICLGDIADRGDNVPQCIERLNQIKNLVYVLGNHDLWLRNWLRYNYIAEGWLNKGGKQSIDAYLKNKNLIDQHVDFFYKGVFFYVDENHRLYAHAGIDVDKSLSENSVEDFVFSKKMWNALQNGEMNSVSFYLQDGTYVDNKSIFIGHIQTSKKHPDLKPVCKGNVWNLDQGAARNGKLTIMQVDTKEYWQSDRVDTLST